MTACLLSPLSLQWVRLPGRAKSSEEETIGVTGTRMAKNRASSPSNAPVLGFSCCARVLVARGMAGAQQGTVRPDVRSSSTALSHPKPKCQGGQQSGLSTGLFHFKSQQFVLSSQTLPPKTFTNSWRGLPLCLWSTSKPPLPREQSAPSPSIRHARPFWDVVTDLEISAWTGHAKRWAAESSRIAKHSHHTWRPQVSLRWEGVQRGTNPPSSAVPSGCTLHPSNRGLLHRGQR